MREQVPRGIDLVVGTVRQQPHCVAVCTHLGIDITRYKVVVLKSSVHFRADFQPIAREVLVVRAGGGEEEQRHAAQAADDSRFYVGGTLGVAVITPDDLDVNTRHRSHGNLSGGVFAGARLGALPIRNGWPVYAEIGYQDIASHKVSYYVGNGTTELTARGHSSYLAGKVNAPLTQRLSLYGKLGVARNSVTGSTPAGKTSRKKNLTEIMAAHRVPYVATASAGHLPDMLRKVEKAKAMQGTRIITLLIPCMDGWGVADDGALTTARHAVESGAFPLYEIEDGRRYTLNHTERSCTLSSYLSLQRRYRHLTAEQIDSLQAGIDEAWADLLQRTAASKTPAN